MVRRVLAAQDSSRFGHSLTTKQEPPSPRAHHARAMARLGEFVDRHSANEPTRPCIDVSPMLPSNVTFAAQTPICAGALVEDGEAVTEGSPRMIRSSAGAVLSRQVRARPDLPHRPRAPSSIRPSFQAPRLTTTPALFALLI